MDIFSHTLWAGAAAKAINHHTSKNGKKPLNVFEAAFWGVFPDLFAFTPLVLWLTWNLAFGGISFSDFPRPEDTDVLHRKNIPMFALAHSLYDLSHSLVVFLVVFAVVYWFLRRPVWELLGWPMHILIDMPMHSAQFFPTPFLWPLADVHIDGTPWASLWILIPNVALLILVYFAFYLMHRHDKKRDILHS